MNMIEGEWLPADWKLVVVDGRLLVRRGADLMTPTEAIALRDLLVTSSRKAQKRRP